MPFVLIHHIHFEGSCISPPMFCNVLQTRLIYLLELYIFLRKLCICLLRLDGVYPESSLLSWYIERLDFRVQNRIVSWTIAPTSRFETMAGKSSFRQAQQAVNTLLRCQEVEFSEGVLQYSLRARRERDFRTKQKSQNYMECHHS